MTRTKRSLPRKPSAFPAASGSTPTSSLAGRQPLSGLQAGRTPCSIRSLEARAVSTATPTRPTQRILTSPTAMLLMVTPTCGGPIKTRLTFLVLSLSLVARRLRKPRRSPQTCRHRSEEHTSELQSRLHLVCRLLLEKKKKTTLNRHVLTHDHHES